jgi:hypothetical protein
MHLRDEFLRHVNKETDTFPTGLDDKSSKNHFFKIQINTDYPKGNWKIWFFSQKKVWSFPNLLAISYIDLSVLFPEIFYDENTNAQILWSYDAMPSW